MFKEFTAENQNTYEYQSNKTFDLTQADLTRHQFLSGSAHPVSKSYYNFSRINFYFNCITSYLFYKKYYFVYFSYLFKAVIF